MYVSSIPFTSDEINLIEQAGLTIAELRDFYERFPDQDLVTAIAGCLEEKQHKSEGATIPLDSSLQTTANDATSEECHAEPTETEPLNATTATEDSKLSEVDQSAT